MLKSVNQPIRKKDAMALVTGKPVYMDDLGIFDHALIIKALRSPHAHAMIESIDTKVASRIPGIEAIFTYEDVPNERFTLAGQTYPELSPYDRLIMDRHIRCVGDPVALVAGTDEKAIDRALKAIKVKYEILPALLDFHDAIGSDILIHPEDNWKALDFIGADNKTNRCASETTSDGDVESVLADCDIVIEGYVDPSEEKVIEGPFGDHTGFYSLEDYYPLFHVTAITHRRGAVYPATIVGVPPQEDAYIAKATEKIFLAPIRAAMLPEVRDLWMPEAGVAHNIAVVDIRTDYAGQALKAASSLWGAGQMMFNKFMVVTASGRPVRDVAALADLLRRIRIPDDLMFSRGPLDVLDHAAPETGLGGKLMFDATGVDPAAPLETVQLPLPFELSDGFVRVHYALSESWMVLLLSAPRGVRPDVFAFLEKNRVEGIKYVILLDEEVDTSRPGDVLWIASSNCDPSRDVTIRDGVVLFDCRSKAGGVNGFSRRWPNVVASSPETIARVDGRWNEYGLGKFMLSPSLHYSRLQYGEGAAVPAGGPLPGKTTEDTHAESGGSCRNPKQNPSG